MKQSGGEIIVEYLIREKVPYVFGICGHGNIGLLDALYDRADAIKTISTRRCSHGLSNPHTEPHRSAQVQRGSRFQVSVYLVRRHTHQVDRSDQVVPAGRFQTDRGSRVRPTLAAAVLIEV